MREVLLITVDPAKAPQDKIDQVKALAGGLQVVVTADPIEIKKLQDRVKIVAGPSRTVIWQASKLRWIQLFSAGADALMKAPSLPQGILVTTTSGMHGPQMAELAFTHLLFLARGIRTRIRHQNERFWPRQEQIHDVVYLSGKTMLIAGLGPIGRHIGTIARAFGIKTVGFRRDPTSECPEVDHIVGPDDLDNALGSIDIVMNVLPHTFETERFFDKRRLRLLKSSCFFINLGRGKTVDEAALAQLLLEKKISGAGLDVFDTEPLPPDSPFWKLENVLITPHEGGSIPDYVAQALGIFIENLARYQQGKRLRNEVDLQHYRS